MGILYLSAIIMSTLEQENIALRQENFVLKERINQLERLIFSSKRERFVPTELPGQGSLFDVEELEVKQPVEQEVVVVKTKVKPKKKPNKPVKRNQFPAEIRREETIINPEGDIEGLTKIGQDETELLSYKPAEIYIKKIIRPRLVDNKDEDKGVLQANIPPRLIPKGMVDESLVAQLIIEKILFHTPVYRFAKKLRLLGIDFIKQNNLYNWFHRGAESLIPLYYLLQQEVLNSGYVQADESHIKVLTKNKPEAAHRGQMWVYFSPIINAVFFNYDPKRDIRAAKEILEYYEGIIQSDGYSVYQKIAASRLIQLIHCFAHARRKFFEAKISHPQLAEFFLSLIQQLYNIEQKARNQKMSPQQRLELRQKEAIPILNQLYNALLEKSADRNILPKSLMRKAIDYSLKLWEGLCAYAHNGLLEIDNNLVENTIRPIALGRKNYLFAGSHDAAQNLAVLYSIVASCEKNNINTFKYLNWILRKVANNKITPQAVQWLPHNIDPKILDEFNL